MNFLFISTEGLSADLAWSVSKEGNAVRFCNEDPEEQEVGEGLFEIVPSWQDHVDWAEVIVLDDVLGKGELAVRLRERGKRVVGGTPYTDRLEDDREFGQDELAKAGVATIPRWKFSRWNDAAAFVRKNPGRYVVKPEGESQNLKSLLYVGEDEDGADVIRVLEDYGKAFDDADLQLQRFTAGVEVGVGAFFNGKRFVGPVCIGFEHKRLFPGDIGPMTGEMGTLICWRAQNEMFERTLRKMESRIAQERYAGYVDLNCIANEDGIWPLEWTMRFGYPFVNIQQEAIAMPIGEFLSGLADGTLEEYTVRKGFQVGVRLVIPPWPFADQGTFTVTQTKEALKHPEIVIQGSDAGIHIEYVKREGDRFFVAGTGTCILVVVGCSASVKDAQREAYERISRVRIPMMYYRNDIGAKWENEGPLLERWGYLTRD